MSRPKGKQRLRYNVIIKTTTTEKTHLGLGLIVGKQYTGRGGGGGREKPESPTEVACVNLNGLVLR